MHFALYTNNSFFSKITKQNKTMVTKMSSNKKGSLVSFRHSAEMAALHQKAGTHVKELIKMYPQYSRASIYRHAKKKLCTEPPQDRRRFNKGRPTKVSVRDHRQILRSLTKLRATEGVFISGRIATHAGVSEHLSRRTVRRVLNKEGYFYLQARKKGLLSRQDLGDRVAFCRKVLKQILGPDFWRKKYCLLFRWYRLSI